LLERRFPFLAGGNGNALPASCAAAILRGVRFFRSILLLSAATLLWGCESFSYTSNVFSRNRPYRKVRVTNLEGGLIADWIAEGFVHRSGNGYRFKAVQRLSGDPLPQVTKYPLGRRVLVHGPHIVIFPCGKPEWLYRLDGF